MLDSATQTPVAEEAPTAETAVFAPDENFDKLNQTPNVKADIIEEIRAACRECKSYGNGEGHFGNEWHERLLELLHPSYKVRLLIADDPDRLAIVIRMSGVKTTKASRKNASLICVAVTARPQDTPQRKLCSSWAEILNEAYAKGISLEEFVEWVKSRNKRRTDANTASTPTEPRSVTENKIQPKLRLTGVDGRRDEILSLPSSVHAELLDAMRAPCAQSERVERMAMSLLTLAEELKTAEKASAPLTSTAAPEASAATEEVVDA